MMEPLPARVAALALVLAVSGCDCGGSINPGRACSTTTDCPAGQMCVAGHCMRPDAGGSDGAPSDAPMADTGTCAVASDEPATRPVDVIIAVDQSASTGEENAAIAANINDSLVEILEASGLDYRVVLINTDARLCPGPPLGVAGDCLASNPPRYRRVLQGVNNSDALTLLLWTYDGVGKRPNSCVRVPDESLRWSDFLRYDSLKVFLVFSDDDPSSYSAAGGEPSCRGGTPYEGCTAPSCPTFDCDGLDWGTICPNFGCPTFADRPADWGGDDFVTELYRLEPAGMFGTPAEPKWVFHSLVGLSSELEATEPVTDRCDLCDFSGNTAEASGVEYQKLSVLSGGVRFPSCNTDYSPVFRRIASTIVPLACEFLLESTMLGDIDPMRTNVLYYPGDGSDPETVPQDTRFGCDEGADGWQWNEDMTRIRLCGFACERLQDDPMARVEISVGCETVIRPPI